MTPDLELISTLQAENAKLHEEVARLQKAMREIKDDLIGVDIAAHAAVIAEEALSLGSLAQKFPERKGKDCPDWCDNPAHADGFVQLREALAHEKKMATDYYGEAKEGWTNFRALERKNEELRTHLKYVIWLAERLGPYANEYHREEAIQMMAGTLAEAKAVYLSRVETRDRVCVTCKFDGNEELKEFSSMSRSFRQTAKGWICSKCP